MDKADKADTVYGFVRAYILEFDGAPNYRELSDACGITLSQINRVLQQLVDEGRLVRIPRRARAISLPRPSRSITRSLILSANPPIHLPAINRGPER